MTHEPDISSRIVIAMRDYAAKHVGHEVAGEVFEGACQEHAVDIADAQDPRGWVPAEMFHSLADGLTPLVRGDFICDAVAWIIPARRELSSMSLSALARPSVFYRALDRARGFYAKHVSFDVEMTGACSARVELHYRDDLPQRTESCSVARGVLTAIPILFNMPAAVVEERECYGRGADKCSYDVSWTPTARTALVGFALGAVIGAIGAVFWPTFLWLAAPALGWLGGRAQIVSSRRRHVMVVCEEQRVALGNAEADLERRFRELLDLKATLQSVERAQTEILDAGVQALLGELVGEFAHEMRNPMSSVLFNISFLEGVTKTGDREGEIERLKSTDSVEVDAVLGDIRYGVERMGTVLAWFVDVFRSGGQEPGLISLDTEVERAASLLRREWAGRIEVHTNCAGTPMVKSFGKEVVQVLINLLVNAAHATKRGNIWIKTEQIDDEIIVTIRDDGTGMPADVLKRAFERGFTTKETGPNRGRGLGLFICKKITERNRGKIELTSEPGAGTTATVTFPVADGPNAPGPLGPARAYAP